MSIRYQADKHEIVIGLRYLDPRKDGVKASGARYQGQTQTWHLSANLTDEQVERLESLGFELPEGWQPAGGARPAGQRAAAGPPAPRPAAPAAVEDTIAISAPLRGQTVSEVTETIRRAVAAAFAGAIWVRGIARVRPSGRTGGALYFELADCDAQGNEVAKMNAVIWGSDVERVLRPLRDADLELTDGLPVCLRAKVNFSARQGRAELQVLEFDPAASLGEIALKRDAVVRAMTAEGLARAALERPMPMLPMRIALVSSMGSDGYIDFRKQLVESGYGFRVTDFDVRVQGESLEPTVLAAFERIAAAAPDFDLVVVTRGGGGKGDLASWDNLPVARAVAKCAVKVLVAIGHTADTTALDRMALSRPTPTDAGRFVAGLVGEADDRAANLFLEAMEQVSARLASHAALLDDLASRTAERAAEQVLSAERDLHAVAVLIGSRVAHRVALEGGALQRFEISLRRTPQVLQRRSVTLARFGEAVGRGSAQRLERESARQERVAGSLARASRVTTDRASQRLAALELGVRLADPANILRRGFALVRRSDGSLLTQASGAGTGEVVTVELRDGRLRARVEQTETHQNEQRTTEQDG